MDKFICRICGYDGTHGNRQGFSTHITHKHKITTKEYYDMYFKQPGEDICPSCGKPTKFRDMWYGYNKHCCPGCVPKDPVVKEKTKNTCMKKYGTEYAFQSKVVIDKIRNTMQARYGVNSYLQTPRCRKIIAKISASEAVKEKIKQTCMTHFGVNCAFKAESVKNKIKITMLDRYNVDNAAKSKIFRSKACKTRIKNGNHSGLEDNLENFFIEHNINFKKQYKEVRYPYRCDFYLPDTDTFIEIHGFWMHGGHWFDYNNAKDNEILNYWKSKSNDTYIKAIDCWTRSDLERRKVAIENSLNYIVLWDINDIENYKKSFL